VGTGLLASAPIELAQARLLVSAIPGPCLIAEVVSEGFTVLAVDPLLRRLITGAHHPAGPHHADVLTADGFGVLGPAMRAAVEEPFEARSLEVPIGDDPQWFELRVTPVVDSGRCQQVLVAGAEHTTQHDVEKRHRRERCRFEAMVEHAPGLVLLTDSAGRIVKASTGVTRLLGLDAQELLGRPVFQLMHPDTLARAASIFNHILGLPGEPLRVRDFRLGHADHTYRSCDTTITNLLHDDDVAAIVFNAHDVTELVLAQQRLELATSSDALTGLANRRELLARLNETFERGESAPSGVGLVLVDVDELALVNDSLGHDVGDNALKTLASRLSKLAGEHALVARVGGDELALLVTDLDDPQRLDRLASSILEAVRAPIQGPGGEVLLRASVGTASASPKTSTGDALLRAADLALFRAKATGKNRTVRYTAEMQLEAEARLEEVTALQRALHEERLRLNYQPIVRLDGALVGVEALLRWDSDGELISPAAFLDVAEDTGLILPIGSWVINQACRDFIELKMAAPDLQWVSINLSSGQLLDQRLPEILARALADHGLSPDCLAVEIDQTTLRDHVGARAMLSELGDIRSMVSFDEIGDDWGLLSALHDQGTHVIKLGRGFVGQLDVDTDGANKTLAMAVLELARTDGLEVIAEGVESREQLEVLEELGCPLAQGYLYSPPIDLATFITVASAQRT
jgi:diguanylate cyclase (GGDEF)-like protein/PAS domain S-box-containing protein